VRAQVILIGLIMCLSASLGDAAPLDVVETADFGNYDGQSEDLGMLDRGVNVVVGSVARSLSDNADFWDVDVPEGLELVEAGIVVSDFNGTLCRGWVDDAVPGATPTLKATDDFTANGTYTLPATDGSFPFPAGHYYFFTSALGATSTRCDYEWYVTVPEANTATGAIAALLTLGFLGRSRSR